MYDRPAGSSSSVSAGFIPLFRFESWLLPTPPSPCLLRSRVLVKPCDDRAPPDTRPALPPSPSDSIPRRRSRSPSPSRLVASRRVVAACAGRPRRDVAGVTVTVGRGRSTPSDTARRVTAPPTAARADRDSCVPDSHADPARPDAHAEAAGENLSRQGARQPGPKEHASARRADLLNILGPTDDRLAHPRADCAAWDLRGSPGATSAGWARGLERQGVASTSRGRPTLAGDRTPVRAIRATVLTGGLLSARRTSWGSTAEGPRTHGSWGDDVTHLYVTTRVSAVSTLGRVARTERAIPPSTLRGLPQVAPPTFRIRIGRPFRPGSTRAG